MKILTSEQRKELLQFLPLMKRSLKEWLFVDVRLAEPLDKNFGVTQAAEMVCAQFKEKEGLVYVCNSREILMLLRWGMIAANTNAVAKGVSERMPDGSCEINVREPTPEGLLKLEMLIAPSASGFAVLRAKRKENVILVVDDDMYMRLLVKKGSGSLHTIVEVDSGDKVLEAYKKNVPDLVFLDIHMPNMSGPDALRELLAIDPKAYVIMLSADSSLENVANMTKLGASGFMTKPFNKEKLQEYILKCPTITQA